MRPTQFPFIAFFLACALSPAALAGLNVNQTFTNNTGQAAGGFYWWFTPDCTTSNLSSSAFSLGMTSLYNPGTHGYTTTLRVAYSNGNVNNGGTSSFAATLSSNSAIGYRTEWTNTNGVPIGSANIPCSIGGDYYVDLNSNLVCKVRIDNPNTSVLLIDSFKFGISQIDLYGEALRNFSNWTYVPGTIQVPPGGVFEYPVVVPDASYYAVAGAELHSDLVPSDISTLVFQVTPEPGALVAAAMLLAVLLPRRSR